MSLAITAASVENDNNDNYGFNSSSNETPIQRKRAALAPKNHNKTQKRFESEFNPEKVNSVLESIHSTMDINGELADYNPRDIADTLKKIIPINPLSNKGNNETFKGNNSSSKEGFEVPQPLENDSLGLQELNQSFLNDAQVRDYYKKLVPTFNSSTKDSNRNSNVNSNTNAKGFAAFSGPEVNASNDLLLTKLNYMINLLENQQDERTQNVTEEVVLYSFLGVFIIFVVDSFARVGKYIR